jgi:hypothetical protein
VPDLQAVSRWLAAIEIKPLHVDITMPCVDREVPASMRELAGPMAGAAFTAVRPRSNRRRGGECVRIRAYPDDIKGAATTVAHTTHLWLVRARTELDTTAHVSAT